MMTTSQIEVPSLRHEVDRCLEAGQWQKAAAHLRLLWDTQPSNALAGYIVAAFGKMRPNLDLTAHRCAILRSFTVEPLVPVLQACAIASRIDLRLRLSGFNAYAQDILDPGSPLYSFEPDTAILAVQTRDLAPELWQGCTRSGEDVIERVTEAFASWVYAFRAYSAANLIIHSLESPAVPVQGIYDAQLEQNQAAAIEQINRNLRKLAREYPGIYVLDYDGLVARYGRERWSDERKWLATRLPIAAPNLVNLAREWMRFLAPLAGKLAKVVAVDLDNTLWGGIIGEDGMAGVQVGTEYPGAAYQAFQQALLDLFHRGILLAACSKNNPAEALEVLESHPNMLIRKEHFAAMRINWNEKAENLREIAAELNVGLDAVLFVDDNPVERQHVREQVPDVMVLELPSDAMDYARALRQFPGCERLTISEEDRQRGRYYAAQKERAQLEKSVSSRDEFLRSLEQKAEIELINRLTVARVAQLTQKTNQFNLTTRRYTEQQIAQMTSCEGWEVFSIKVRDRYADNGLVGVAILQHRGETTEIDTFLLSCRVIGRTVESALLACLVKRAQNRGAKRLEGWFLPTKKNTPAKDFYRFHGFNQLSETLAGQLWSLELDGTILEFPEWIQVTSPEL